jgi:ribosome biogenesis protein BMS1
VLCCWQPIERQPRHFNKLKIPQALESALPFASKPKLLKKRKQPLLEQKRAVVMEPHERHVQALVNQLNTIRNEKASYSVVRIDAVPYVESVLELWVCRVK